MGAWDPLTGGSGIIPPEAKMGAAVGALFLCFFSLVQSLRCVQASLMLAALGSINCAFPEVGSICATL